MLAALLATPLLVQTARADSQAVSMTVTVSYHGTVKGGDWMPVDVQLSNSGSDLQGTLQIIPAALAQTVYAVGLSLPAGSTKNVRTYINSDSPSSTVTADLVVGGRVVASQSTSPSTTAPILVGVLSDSDTNFDEFGAIRFPGASTAAVVHLQRSDIPENPLYLRGFTLLAIDDYATDSLTASQRSAIAAYVADGGSLLLGSGPAWHKTVAALPPSLVPFQAQGTAVLHPTGDLSGLSGTEVVTGSSLAGTAWLADGTQPLLVEAPVGLGTVTLSTFAWDQDPVAAWSGDRDLLRQIGIRALSMHPTEFTALGMGGGGPIPGPFVISGNSFTQHANVITSVLGNLPALDIPSLQLTGALVLLYILVIGPLNYLVLARLRRRELAWVTIPAISLVFAVGAYGFGVGTKGSSIQGNQISIVHLVPGSDQASAETFTGVLAPTRGDYTVTIAGSGDAIGPLPQNGNGSGMVTISPAQNAVDLQGVTAFSLRGFATESLVPAPQISASISLSNGNLVGTVHNGSSLHFDDVLVLAGDAYQRLGPLGPGRDAGVNLTPRVVSVFTGPPSYLRIYPNTFFGGPPTQSDSERIGQERTQMLQILSSNGNAKLTGALPVQPMVVGFTSAPIQSIRVNGGAPRLQAQTAVVLPLPLTQLRTGAIPAGLVGGRVIDVSGSPDLGPNGVSFSSAGTAVFEFQPLLRPSLHLSGAGISATNPFGVAVAGASTVPVTSEYWDWGQQRWQAFTLTSNASNALPDSGVNPSTATVRIRLSTTSGCGTVGPQCIPAQLGALSLTGTVQ